MCNGAGKPGINRKAVVPVKRVEIPCRRGVPNEVVTAETKYVFPKPGIDPKKDRDVRAGLEFILKAPTPQHTYDAGIVAMALEASGGKRFRKKIAECAKFLVSTQKESGIWAYPSGNGDNSNSQYAVLGLRAAVKAGVKVPARTWRAAANHFLDTQNEDGGWPYVPGPTAGTSTSMTAAGLASLLVCLENLEASKDERERILAAIDRGFTILGEKMKIDRDSLYALYGIERAGVLGRRGAMGGKPWYGPGAVSLVEEQDRRGFWTGGYNEAVQTAFAILFLKKFTAPIATK